MKKIAIAVLLLISLNFYQNFWLQSASLSEQRDLVQANENSAIKDKNATPSVSSYGLLFGKFDSGDEPAEVDASKEELFVEENKKYIAQLGQYEYLLYATAKVKNKQNAKVLVRNLEDFSVTLLTLEQNDKVNDATIAFVSLSEVELSQENQKITLQLFERN